LQNQELFFGIRGSSSEEGALLRIRQNKGFLQNMALFADRGALSRIKGILQNSVSQNKGLFPE